VVVGNEVLDAMPVKLLVRKGGQAGLARARRGGAGTTAWAGPTAPQTCARPWRSRARTTYLTEIHPQADAFMRTLADRLDRGAAFFIDYGFPRPSTTTRSATWAR
jgi:SAM-dependent MidA family methyltransferase